MQLNNQLRDMPYLWIHVSENREYQQGYAQMHLSPPSPDAKWFLEKYWEPACAFVFPELEGDLWDRYEKKKIEFVNEVTLETAQGKAGDLISDGFTNLAGWLNEEYGQSLRKIGEKSGVDFTAIQKRLKKSHPL
jgi:hypothetical protein